jgi:hypothetical protein
MSQFLCATDANHSVTEGKAVSEPSLTRSADWRCFCGDTDTLPKILWIRHGPGAAILPPNVSRIHLEFAKRLNGGHMGPRFVAPLRDFTAADWGLRGGGVLTLS